MRLLIDGHDAFLNETRALLRAGLETAEWVTVDDTGVRRRGANAVCTQIGNDSFAWFGTKRPQFAPPAPRRTEPVGLQVGIKPPDHDHACSPALRRRRTVCLDRD
jgi:hypothetical protein